MARRKRLDLLIIVGFAFLLLLIIAISFIGRAGLIKTEILFHQTYQNSLQTWVETEQANTDLIAVHRAMKDVALSRNHLQFQAALDDVYFYNSKIRTYFATMMQTKTDSALLIDVISAYDDWAPIRDHTINLAENGQYDQAAENTRTVGSNQVELIESKMQLLIDQHKADAEQAYQLSESKAAASIRFLLLMTIIATALALLISVFIRNSLLRFQTLLHEEKEKLQITLDSIGDGVITTDQHQNVVTLNKVAEEFTGWRTVDALGKPFKQVFDITNAYTGKRAKDPVEEVLTTDSICLLENHTILTSQDGTQRHIADSAAPIKDENGQTFGVVMIFRDVTERKISEQLLKEREEKFRTIFNQSPIGISITNSLTGQIIEMNDRFALIAGRTCEELSQLDWMSITHPDDIEKDLEQFSDLQRGIISSYHMEKRYIKPDASIVWINMSIAVVKDSSHENPLHLCMIEDITQQKLAENDLRVNENRLKTAQTLANVGNWELDLTTNLMWASEQAFKIYGYQNNTSLLPLAIAQDAVCRADRKMLDEALRSLLVENKPYDVQFAINRVNDNVLRNVHSNAVIERDGSGKPIKVLGTIQDITDLKRSEQALLDSEAKHKSMIANISDSIIIVDENGFVGYTSPNLENLFGWNQEDFANKDLFEFIYPDDLGHIRAGFLDLLQETGQEETFEFRLKIKNGYYKYIHLTAVNMMDNPSIKGILMNFYDISESKSRENEILYLNYHDLLTGLYNRAFFEEECARLDTDRQLPISVIMGDINGLKLINDAFGHKEGDKLLTEIAKILTLSCRTEDIIARTGGDEFCILLPKTTAEEARTICKRIYNDCLAYDNRTDKDMFYLSISLGSATKTTLEASLERILTEAEEHMYKQKLLERKSMRSSLISSIKTTMLEKSHLTAEHEERLVVLSKLIGQALDLPDAQINELELLSTLHDLGKLSIDDQILNKPGQLTADEWTEIRKHPDVGYRIAQASPELAPISDYILCHHERWDGKGYPQGLKGEEIPLLSRIVSVVDAYDAMTQDRPYRQAMPDSEAIEEIDKNAGTQFDPEIAKISISVLKSL